MIRFWLILFLLGACQKPATSEVAEIQEIALPTPPVRHVAAKAVTAATVQAAPQMSPMGDKSQQRDRWEQARIKASAQISIDKAVMLYERTKDRYLEVQCMRNNGVPAPVIFALHYRESSNSFRAHLHEGSSLLNRTRYVPKGRLPAPDNPPYEWEHSAEDAIYVCDKLQGPWSDLTWSLNKIEGYNGLGYRRLGVPSPYLWAGTTVYDRGKYTSDGHFNADAYDQQLGVCAILLRLRQRNTAVSFLP